MDLSMIVLLLIGVVVVFAATRFLNTKEKIITKIFLIIVVLLIALALFWTLELQELKKGFGSESNTFVLYDQERVYSVVTLEPITTGEFSTESFTYLDRAELDELEKTFTTQYAKQGSYKTFIVGTKILNLPYELEVGAVLSTKELLELATANDTYETLADMLEIKLGYDKSELLPVLEKTYGPKEKMRGYIFSALLINYFQKDQASLVKKLKSKELIINPESWSFFIIRHLPIW